MKNLEILLRKNYKFNKKRIPVSKDGIHFITDAGEFDGLELVKLINFIGSVRRQYKSKQIPIIFEFKTPNIKVRDKLVYVMFECLCYSLRKEGRKVYILWDPKDTITTQGVFTSPLRLLSGTSHRDEKSYITKFEDDISQTHYRKLMKVQDLKSNYLGRSIEDMSYSLKLLGLSESVIDKLSEVVEELVGNAGEHVASDCLVDIDVTTPHSKKDEGEDADEYIGINVAIVSFSETLFGDGIKDKILTNTFEAQRYSDLSIAHDNHMLLVKDSIDDYEEYFWNIAALQDKISGRRNLDTTGGTGLTVLINSLQKEAYGEYCYIMSGSKIIFFHKDYINFDENHWLTFNKQGNFFHQLPEEKLLWFSNVFLPGTAYNLNFVMKKGEE
ncbi:hypothetical protein [Lactococcus lactis]|uniref:hypothetical protein n=1 Tax=Lactococcus lactis TaxID=1358 RepID=UPI00289201F4|nr:hypothetical protein [Lactococcus lactis]MDT2878136.1 hypothetical protein [Lactococcus lactis]MDT2885892.1 hypothetical protein [Lactococcus lactis]MDT2902207.1 hypothetical protein [Lactococcus lactis]MDT2929011.1 hypothetical protein [Lactococcus lactis]